jgi:hypothetical protein
MPERVKNGQTALERRLRFTFDISPVGAVEQRAGILRSATLLGGDSVQNARFVQSPALKFRLRSDAAVFHSLVLSGPI